MPLGSGSGARVSLAGVVTLAGCLCVGCPSPAEKTGEAQASPSAASTPAASPASSPLVLEQPEPAGPGPAGPGMPTYPEPEDGVSGTSQLRSMEVPLGDMKLQVWIADTPASRQLGLMHVKDLPEDRGMVFVYPAAGRRSFYMRNCYVPLSLAYIRSDGTIDQILDMAVPPAAERENPRARYPSQGVIRLVLEVNQGWFERHGVKVGDVVPGVSGLIGY